jgi:hypothetical protein
MAGELLPGTSHFTVFQPFELRDGNLGLMWPERFAAANRRSSVRKGRILKARELGHALTGLLPV